MQTEDFVTCEIAQALKREGFDWPCRAVWHFDGSDWQLIPDYGATFRHPYCRKCLDKAKRELITQLLTQ